MGGWVILATDILVMPGLAQIAGTPNFAAATSAGSAAASEYAGAVDATPMTTFDANDMAFFFSACVMSKRNVPQPLASAVGTL